MRALHQPRTIQLSLFAHSMSRPFSFDLSAYFPSYFFSLPKKTGKAAERGDLSQTTTVKIRNLLFLKPHGKRKKYWQPYVHICQTANLRENLTYLKIHLVLLLTRS
jgi:hypothetical protein